MRPMRFTILCTPTDSSDKTRWDVPLYCFACLYHILEVVQPSWIAVQCPTTKLSLLVSKSFVGIKQCVIRVALKTLLKKQGWESEFTKLPFGIGRWLCWFYIKLSPPHFTTKLRPCIKYKRQKTFAHSKFFGRAERVSDRIFAALNYRRFLLSARKCCMDLIGTCLREHANVC